jgi:hypothetical protein
MLLAKQHILWGYEVLDLDISQEFGSGGDRSLTQGVAEKVI